MKENEKVDILPNKIFIYSQFQGHCYLLIIYIYKNFLLETAQSFC